MPENIDSDFKTRVLKFFKTLQISICSEIEELDNDGAIPFIKEEWNRTDISGGHGGGGISALLRNGNIFEQAGVNFSAVEGTLPADMVNKLLGINNSAQFFATGVSLVFHPFSPQIPTTHANVRYLEVNAKGLATQRWFGGGADLTPYLLYEEDATHFHAVLKEACDKHDEEFYSKFKKECDEYFYLPHRQEARGVGGIFFDYLGKNLASNEISYVEQFFPFVQSVGAAITAAYIPIVIRRKNLAYTSEEKQFQLFRRGRYVEFNLLYDRGTLFGLKTGGRTASILMSLPPQVHFHPSEPAPPSLEAVNLLKVVSSPRDWLDIK